MTRYFDASALAKRYLDEPGTPAVQGAIASGRVVTSRLSEVEVTSAIARRVREGRIHRRDADRLVNQIVLDFGAFGVMDLSPEIAAMARAFLFSHALRASDAVHLASASFVQQALERPIEFVCFDDALGAAARVQGLNATRLGA